MFMGQWVLKPDDSHDRTCLKPRRLVQFERAANVREIALDDDLRGQVERQQMLYQSRLMQFESALDLSALASLEYASRQTDIHQLERRLDSLKQRLGRRGQDFKELQLLWLRAFERLLSCPWSLVSGSAEPCIEVKQILDAYFSRSGPHPAALKGLSNLKDYVDRYYPSSPRGSNGVEASQT